MSAPARLEALTLAHDPADPTTSAIALRHDAGTPVTLPEWRRASCVNPEDAPVAYAAARVTAPAVLVQVRRTQPGLAGGELRAEPAGGPDADAPGEPAGVLGRIAPTPVSFGDDDLVTVRAVLSGDRLNQAAPDVLDVRWRWAWRTGDGDPWTELDETELRVYALLDVPTAPWQPAPVDASNTQLPWTAVLGYSCRWARGAANPAEAARLITQSVFDLAPDLIGTDVRSWARRSTPRPPSTAPHSWTACAAVSAMGAT